MQITQIEISSLVTKGLQTRDGLANAVVKDYAESARAGSKLPPVTVIRETVPAPDPAAPAPHPDADASVRLRYYLVDGYHRVAAAERLGLTTIDAEVIDGDFTAALRLALKANAEHGLRRTNADKRNALRMAWENREALFGGTPTKEMLAEACAVSRSTVKRFYSHIQKGSKEPLFNRVCKDGRKYRLNPHSPLPTPQSPTPNPHSPTTDRFGVEIPANLLAAFELSRYRDIVRMLREALTAVEAEQEACNLAFAKVSQSTRITMRNAAEDLKAELPFCVCRICGGAGCRACGNIGVQTKAEYDRNPNEVKPDA